MPHPPSPLPPGLTDDPFGYSEARREGVSRRRLRGADLTHPYRGIYAVAPQELDTLARCELLRPLLSPRQHLSHLTAARLLGVPVPFAARGEEALHVTTTAGAAPMRRPGVVGWETEEPTPSVVMLGILPVAAPADVWCHLAVPGGAGGDPKTKRRGRLSDEWLIAAGDYLLTGPGRGMRRTPLCTFEELEAAVSRRRGMRGVRALTRALPRLRRGPHSAQESLLRIGLVDHGLPEPEVQVPVMTADGLRHADLGYPEARLLLEYQGDQHRTDRQQWLADLTRVQLFEDAGFHTILVGYADTHPQMSPLASRIRRALVRARETS